MKNASPTRLSPHTKRSGTRLNGHSKKKDSTGTTSALMSIRSRVRLIFALIPGLLTPPTLQKIGKEDHFIVISLVRTKELGFMTSLQRTNVMLTRCQRGMYIVSSKAFLQGSGANSLVGMMAAELGTRPGAWLTRRDIETGRFGL
jgi:hypothetical protein